MSLLLLLFLIISILASYLIGSFSSSVWVGVKFYKTDPREYGSGNAGATNTFRVLGKKAGWIVMFLDTLKGFIASSIPLWFVYFNPTLTSTGSQLIVYQLLTGVSAIMGHIFPVYYNFKGGKGVATILGMMFAIHFEAALVCIMIFLTVLILSKYVSLGSMIASFAFPVLISFDRFHHEEPRANAIMTVFGIAVFCLVVLTHQKNIKRLLSGTENKTKISLKKKV